ncbi:MAG: hypothetical protein AAFS10_03765, partial [Myxococcota bacterium]
MANIQTAHGHVTLDALQQQARIRIGISVALGALMFFGGIGLVEFLRLPDNLGEGAAPPTATAAAP